MPQHASIMKALMKKLSAIISLCKLIAALLMMFAMAYVFTAYLDGDIGVVIWSFLIIAPLLSFLLTFLARKAIKAQLSAPTYIAKGRRFAANVRLSAEGKLPVPFLRLKFRSSAGFLPEDERALQTALMPQQPQEIPYPMIAAYAGCGEIALESMRITDFLGLIGFAHALPAPVKVGVIPEIPSLTNAAVMLHAVSDVVMTQDDEEEESAAAFSAVSMPGYVHRDYVPGDNLRRINWKLSAKRNRLMVRMDEAAATVRPSVMLDLGRAETAPALKMRETLMEGALGFLMLLVRQGIACSLRFASEGSWKCLVLESEDAVRTAAVELAMADFVHDGCRLDRSALSDKAGAYLIYTANPDAALSAAAADFRNQGYLCAVVPQSLHVTEVPHADAVWTLSEDFTMTAVQK